MVLKKVSNFSSTLFTKAVAGKAYFKELHKKADAHINGEKKAQGVLEYILLFVVVGLSLVLGLKALRGKLESKLDEAGSVISDTKVNGR